MSRRKLVAKNVHIERLSHEGRGIASYDDKTALVRFALPGEEVVFKPSRYRARVYEGVATEVITRSPQRVPAICKHFGVCGGCDLQHLSSPDQLKLKATTLTEQLKHFGGITDAPEIGFLMGQNSHYRHKARLGVRYVKAKDKVVVGFREALSHFVTDSEECQILAVPEDFMTGLQQTLSMLSIKEFIPQVELAVSDEGITLLVRHLQPMDECDITKLAEYAKANHVHVWLQSGGYETVVPLDEQSPRELSYVLRDFPLTLKFQPSDFTQINLDINQKMIAQALDWLEPTEKDNILDLFCGIGNFSLPMAFRGAEVVGIEWCESMVEKARKNAALNHLKPLFYAHDLTLSCQNEPWYGRKFNKLLLDPPRSGAKEAIMQLEKFDFEKIVYVSCNAATFAHDAGILSHKQGFKLTKLSLMDMFPHTKHVEVMAEFVRA